MRLIITKTKKESSWFCEFNLEDCQWEIIRPLNLIFIHQHPLVPISELPTTIASTGSNFFFFFSFFYYFKKILFIYLFIYLLGKRKGALIFLFVFNKKIVMYRWYSEKFVKGEWKEEECVSEWQKYRACLAVRFFSLIGIFHPFSFLKRLIIVLRNIWMISIWVDSWKPIPLSLTMSTNPQHPLNGPTH